MPGINNESAILPKVLLVGDSFSNVGGGGITMTNLFKGWPKDRLAMATSHIIESGLQSCHLYYRLGYAENKRRWPFYYFQPKYTSGPFIYTDKDVTNNEVTEYKGKLSKYNRNIKQFILWLIQISGLTFLQERIRVTDQFLKWINEFKPDVIYSQLATYELIKFMQEIKEKTDIPVAIHIMDDWPVSLNKPGIFYYYWKYKLDHEFRKLLDKSDIFLSICDAMSREYAKRYNKPFQAYHNPIEVEKWLPYSKKDWKQQGSLKNYFIQGGSARQTERL